MACGCSKRGKPAVLPQVNQPSGRVTTQVAVYEVRKGDEVILSTTNPTAAREEARRLGASLRVTSRPAAEAVPA
jgi:hypothetical protein